MYQTLIPSLVTLTPKWKKSQEENLDTWRESFTEASDILGTGAELVDQAIYVPVATIVSIAKIAIRGERSTLYIGSTLTDHAFEGLFAKGNPVEGMDVGGYTIVDYARLAPTILLPPAATYSPFERRLCAGHELRHAEIIMDAFSRGADKKKIESNLFINEQLAYATAYPIADAELGGEFTPTVAKIAAYLIEQEKPFNTDYEEILKQSKDVYKELNRSFILLNSFRALCSTLVARNRKLKPDEEATFAEILTGQKTSPFLS